MRRVSGPLLLVFGLLPLTGCHPQFQGSLTGRDGTGSGPSPAPGQASIASVSPSTVFAGAASFTLTVNGQNFLTTTTVLWNDNTPLTTTYVSPTVLQAQVPASLIAKPGSANLIPSPMSSLNFGADFTISPPPLTGNNSFSVSMVTVQANDMVFDPVHQQFYLSLTSGSGANPNTIMTLNPQTAALGSPISTNGGAGKLAVSIDGIYLYAGLNSAGLVQRYTLPALQSDIAISLGSGSNGSYYPMDVEVQPGSSRSLAVSKGDKVTSTDTGGIFIYDDAVARTQSIPGYGPGQTTGPIDALNWSSSGQSLYGVNSFGTGLYVMSVSSAGVQLQTPLPGAVVGKAHLDSTTGYFYSDNGNVIEPTTGAVIGSFPLNMIEGGFDGPSIMVPDGKLNIAYFLGQPTFGFSNGYYVLEAYDLTHLTFLGAIPITNVSGTPIKMVRWGNNGLAILTHTGLGSLGDGVYLVSGGFVTSPAP